MKYYIAHSLVFFLLSWSVVAQDDSTESVTSDTSFRKEELEKEKNELKFKAFFIESLKEKSIENYDKALENLAVCEKIFPDNIAMLFELAKNQYALKAYTEAHHYCNKALERDSTNFWVLKLSRDVFIKEYNYNQAIQIQKKLYTQKDLEAGDLLRLYHYAKKKKEAKALIDEIERKFIYVVNLDFYKRQYSKPQYNNKTAEKVYPISLDSQKGKEKSSFRVLKNRLEKQYHQKDYKSLLKESSDGLSLFPAQSVLYLYNGLALNGLGKHQEAISVLEMGLDYVFDKPLTSKRFYKALVSAYNAIQNKSKATYYKKQLEK